MRKVKFLAALLALLLSSYPVWAGCTLSDVCRDVMDSIVITIGGDVDQEIRWDTNSEPYELAYYRVVRSEDPGNNAWTVVETVYPQAKCGASSAEYEVTEPFQGESWTYAIQIWDNDSLICTIIEH